MKFIPHEYQKYAIDFVKDNSIAALFLDMGLG
jgi:membrane-bound lytic murein transglycosylase B